MKTNKNFTKWPLIIAGPCSAETEEQTLETCKHLAETGLVDMLRAGVWKPRTKPGGFEGSGLIGLSWVAKAKELTGLPAGVEVATSKHVESALEFGMDMVWIGARTTGNPFSVQEVADALRGTEVLVLIKNPLTPDLELWSGAVARLLKVGVRPEQLRLAHRGFSFYGHGEYRNPPLWHLALEMRSRFPEIPMVCDPSHICGNRHRLGEVSQKAADLRYDGLIIESHIDPSIALSDASQQLTPASLATLLKSIRWRQSTTDNPEFVETLDKLRGQIDEIDTELIELLSRRMNISEQIGKVKKENDVAILQGSRWSSIVERSMLQAKKLDLNEAFLKTVLEAIHIESINRQNEVMNK
ncbi:MAG: chorismate mutase [Prevotellaceae bacterium]|jgi:chorismate mutase|nr:chorismate mutase [Prevotellaceae bacterium]